MARVAERHRGQAGTTLVELLVATVIMGSALVLIVGTFSAGLLNASVAKRNTAVEAATTYELEKISGAAFPVPAQWSDCFATEVPAKTPGSCSDPGLTLRADVTVSATPSASVQQLKVAIFTLPAGDPVGVPITIYKVNR